MNYQPRALAAGRRSSLLGLGVERLRLSRRWRNRVSLMVRIWTPSRLHFGLLGLPWRRSVAGSSRGARIPARRFGGVGMMVERPDLRIATTDAATWTAEGPLADRALAFARRFSESIRLEQPDAKLPPQTVVVEEAPSEHVGLGVGTQLGLAVARALALAWGYDFDAVELARGSVVECALRSAYMVSRRAVFWWNPANPADAKTHWRRWRCAPPSRPIGALSSSRRARGRACMAPLNLRPLPI